MNGSGGRSPARFLLAVIDAGGTVPPALSLAAELVNRGHQVRVLADPTIKSPPGRLDAPSPPGMRHHTSTRARSRQP
jgi:hypothetical protein